MIPITRLMNPIDRLEDIAEPLFVGEEYAHLFSIIPMKGLSFQEANITTRFIRPDGAEVNPGGYVDSETGYVCVLLSPECYAVSGQYTMYIFAVYPYETLCVCACRGNILPTLSRG